MEVRFEKASAELLPEMYPVFDDSALYEHYFKDSPEMLRFMLDKATINGNTLVAKTLDGEVVGVMVMLMEGFAELPYLALLGVKKGFRNYGIGHKFLSIFIAAAEESGAPNMFIMTSTFNVRAKILYESVGFKRMGVIRNYLKKGIDEIMFVRPNMKNSKIKQSLSL